MKYMLLMSFPMEAFEWYAKWPKEDLEKNMAYMRNFNKELKEAGALVATAGLAWPDKAKIVRAGKNGEPITDGVFRPQTDFCTPRDPAYALRPRRWESLRHGRGSQ